MDFKDFHNFLSSLSVHPSQKVAGRQRSLMPDERQTVVQSRIDLVLREAQRVADFEEFLTLAKQHEASLHATLTLGSPKGCRNNTCLRGLARCK